MDIPGRAETISTIRRALAQAEEKYLVSPDATLGTWFARVHETIAVAAEVTITRMRERRPATEPALVAEQMGLHADICAEAIRAAAQAWGEPPSPRTRDDILDLLAFRSPSEPAGSSWQELLLSLAACTAALEPLANGLRDGDLPMGEPTDRKLVLSSFLGAAELAFGLVNALA